MPDTTLYRPAAAARSTRQSGPACAGCAHASCRTHRAQTLPRLGGHRSEFHAEHRRAASVQARHRHLIIWFGEHTQSYWAATPSGLIEAEDLETLLLLIWQ